MFGVWFETNAELEAGEDYNGESIGTPKMQNLLKEKKTLLEIPTIPTKYFINNFIDIVQCQQNCQQIKNSQRINFQWEYHSVVYSINIKKYRRNLLHYIEEIFCWYLLIFQVERGIKISKPYRLITTKKYQLFLK